MNNPPFPLQGKNREAAKRYYTYRTGKTIRLVWKQKKTSPFSSRTSSWFEWSRTYNPLNRSWGWFSDYERVLNKEE